MTRTVQLRHIDDGTNVFSLWASVLDDGSLQLEGQDLGPVTSPVSGDGEYEYCKIFDPATLPVIVRLLELPGEFHLLDELVAGWSGERSFDLERILREADVPHRFSWWS
jgi:hypothetical protein